MSDVVPTCRRKISNLPVRSDTYAMVWPSGEMLGSPLYPRLVVNGVIVTFDTVGTPDCPRFPIHQPAAGPSTSAAAATAHPARLWGTAIGASRMLGNDFDSHPLFRRRRSSAKSPAC